MLDLGLSREESADRETLTLLTPSAFRTVHKVLVRRLGAGAASGLWTNIVDSDLNLSNKQRNKIFNYL